MMTEADWAEIRRYRRREIFWILLALVFIWAAVTIGEQRREAAGKQLEAKP